MSYEEKTIASVVGEIDSKQIYLPAIQRKYVWTELQITKLMDSIMRGYPFGTFLFWRVKKSTVNKKKYSMYENKIVRDYRDGKITKEQLDKCSTCDFHAKINNGLSEESKEQLKYKTGEEIVDEDIRNQSK